MKCEICGCHIETSRKTGILELDIDVWSTQWYAYMLNVMATVGETKV